MKNSLAGLISVAKGESPADLLLSNAQIVNTFTGEVEAGNVAIYGDRIAGIGDYSHAKQVMDMKGCYLAPGLINGHTHIESSMLHPVQYAQAVVPRGTLAVVTDLHEIANVCGLEGVKYITKWVRRLPFDMFLMAPSCVPATSRETSGATLRSEDIKVALGWKNTIGLGEMMNFPGVLGQDEEVLSKIVLAKGRVIDGHAPGLGGRALNAYLVAGILSDHESTDIEEAREKLRRGMYLMIREGSSEKNLDALLPLVTDMTYKRCLFVVDDRSCADLLREGDIDAVVRKAIRNGLDPVRAIQLATINTAEYFRLDRLGAVAPGYLANLLVIRDLPNLEISLVFYHGHLVARDGQSLFTPSPLSGEELMRTVKVKHFSSEQLRLTATGDNCPVIEVVPGQIITRKRVEKVRISEGIILPGIDRDILKLVVVERHKETGNIGLGLVKGFGLKKGALASSIAHDSHNIVIVGTNDEDIFIAIKEVERLQGGLVASCDGKIIAELPLPVAGLLSTEPLPVVVSQFEEMEKAAHYLGASLPSPFAVLSFVALPVIPELRLTDTGLVDMTIS